MCIHGLGLGVLGRGQARYNCIDASDLQETLEGRPRFSKKEGLLNLFPTLGSAIEQLTEDVVLVAWQLSSRQLRSSWHLSLQGPR